MPTHDNTNPLREGLHARAGVEPCALVIFGATGDLTHRKLVPALYNLAHEGRLPTGFAVVGFARRPKTHDEFRAELREAVEEHSRSHPIDAGVWDALAQGIFYHQSEFADADGYVRLAKFLEQLDRERGTEGNRLFYLATAPTEFDTVVQQLGAHHLNAKARVIIEKPFGHSLDTARELNRRLAGVFKEQQIYRIDHYLGKETVQNILVMRFANEIFEPLWNTKYVDHVQITVAESLGVEGRAAYYDQSGALRDVMQNHMMQLLALTAMEPPNSLEPEVIRDEKVKVLRSARAGDAVRGQYAAGTIDGKKVDGYRQEPKVAADSRTETYVALELFIDNWRWAGVPFYLRHGKRLPKGTAEIAVQFKAVPSILFAADCKTPLRPNTLVLRIQPDEGIAICMNSKVPGTALSIQPVKLDFQYGGSFGAGSPEAYERLLHDALAGDPTLFIRSDETERSWQIMDAVLTGWQSAPPPFAYESGTWGPPEADAFIARDGREWRKP